MIPATNGAPSNGGEEGASMATTTPMTDTTMAIRRAIATWEPPAVTFQPPTDLLRGHLGRHVARVLADNPDAPVIDELVPVDPEAVTYPGDTPDCAWEALPTKAHLTTDDINAPGTGPDGWGIYLEGMPEDGYFAWFSQEHKARFLVADHNAAVDAADEVERLQGELEMASTTALSLRAEVRRLGLRLTHVGIESEAGSWSKHELPLVYALLGQG
jgi:hypothetical protein